MPKIARPERSLCKSRLLSPSRRVCQNFEPKLPRPVNAEIDGACSAASLWQEGMYRGGFQSRTAWAPATRAIRSAALLLHLLHLLADFVQLRGADKSVVVGVHGFEEALHPLGSFLLAELAV